MTDFKRGDRVFVKPGMRSRYGWAPEGDATPLTVVRVEHDYRVVVRGPWDGVEYSFRPEDLTHAEPETPADVDKWAAKDALQAEVAAEVFQTPAPLDPAKVKAGDTVTLLVDPPDTYPAFTVTGETHSLGGSSVYVGGWRVGDLPDYVTLTAHTPAPEPEPAPGYYTVHPTANPEAAWTGLVFEDGSFVGEEDGFYRSASKGEFTVSGRLVVIDPAEAWRNLDHHLAGAGDLTQAEADLLGNVFPEVDLGLDR